MSELVEGARHTKLCIMITKTVFESGQNRPWWTRDTSNPDFLSQESVFCPSICALRVSPGLTSWPRFCSGCSESRNGNEVAAAPHCPFLLSAH